jgi:hypothetical protein
MLCPHWDIYYIPHYHYQFSGWTYFVKYVSFSGYHHPLQLTPKCIQLYNWHNMWLHKFSLQLYILTIYMYNEQKNAHLIDSLLYCLYCSWGHVVAQWLRHCATNQKVVGSIPDGVIGIFLWHNPCGHTMALGSTQPLTEMSTRSISWG